MHELPIEPPEEKGVRVFCPICGEELHMDDELFVSRGDVIGCTHCTERVEWYDYVERLTYDF